MINNNIGTELGNIFGSKVFLRYRGTYTHTDMSTCMVRQYVTTIMTSGIKKATKEPISMKRSSLRTQVPLTKTLFSLWSPMTGIGIDTPREKESGRKESVSVIFISVLRMFVVLSLVFRVSFVDCELYG